MKSSFELLNDYYDKVYVLSIEAALERRMRFADRFKGLNYTFFFGADKNKFSIEQVKENKTYNEDLAIKNHRYGKPMKHGEIACSWSHKMIYEDMLANGYQKVLIFEDDAVPDFERSKEVQAILNQAPPDSELIFWGWTKNAVQTPGSFIKKITYHIQHQLGFLKWNHQIIRNLYARPYSTQLKKAGFHDHTFAYAVSRSGAEKLIKMQTPIQYVADNLLAHAATREIVNAFIVYPAVFLHDFLPDGTSRDSYIR